MLRLCLVLALLAAGASLYFGQMVIKPKIEQLNTDLAQTQSNLETAQTEKAKADKEAKENKTAADKAIKELSDTKGALEAKTSEAAEQRTRADDLAGKFEAISKDHNEAKQKLARWAAVGLQPEQIDDLKREARTTKVERDEAKIAIVGLNKEVKALNNELTRYKNPDAEVVLPAGLKGTITEVGAANDFVFLDIGEAQGVLKGGKLLVRRGDKLISKVRIVSVAKNHSIANVLPEWTQGGLNIQKGDAVLY